MKSTYVLLFLLMTSFALAASSADIRYTLDTQATTNTRIVSDVDYTVIAEMKVASDNFNNNVRDIKVHSLVSGDTEYLHAQRGEWLPNAGNPDQNRDLGSGVWQYMFTAGHGTVDETKGQFKPLINFRLKSRSAGSITLDATKSNEIGGNIEPFDIGTVTGFEINPQHSMCGDGVIGYFDRNDDGRRDTDGSENFEACDGGMGCVCDKDRNLGYIEVCYKGSECSFGSRSCQVTKMNPRECLYEKLKALSSGNCYPLPSEHPSPLYCRTGQPIYTFTPEGNFRGTTATKYAWIKEIVAALHQYFTDAVLVS